MKKVLCGVCVLAEETAAAKGGSVREFETRIDLIKEIAAAHRLYGFRSTVCVAGKAMLAKDGWIELSEAKKVSYAVLPEWDGSICSEYGCVDCYMGRGCPNNLGEDDFSDLFEQVKVDNPECCYFDFGDCMLDNPRCWDCKEFEPVDVADKWEEREMQRRQEEGVGLFTQHLKRNLCGLCGHDTEGKLVCPACGGHGLCAGCGEIPNYCHCGGNC